MFMIALGLLIGTVGTLIGVGGGFLLIPILLYLFPTEKNLWISSVSMWVVALNASSGSVAYWRKGRVHLQAAKVFILASLPGSVLGVWVAGQVNRSTFEMIFGLAMISYAIVIFFRSHKTAHDHSMNNKTQLSPNIYIQGALISVFVGFVAAFFGIGGGVVHVPLLSQVLGFPVHLATGTSHFILAITAWFTTIVHIYNGDISLREPILWQLGCGAVIGAQLGAYLSPRVSSGVILKVLAVALFSVGLRLVGSRFFFA